MAIQYPTLNDLKELFSSSGTPATGLLLQPALSASIDNFETEVGYHMLAGKNSDGSDRPPSTRQFYQERMNEEPQGMIQLNLGPYGAIARIDSVVFNVPNADPKTLVLNTDWWPMPTWAPDEGRPYKWLRVLPYATLFFGLLPLYNAHIDVTGLWGFPRLPADAYMAMLYGAAFMYFEGSWAGIRTGSPSSFPLKSWTGPGGVQSVYDTTWFASRRAMWAGVVTSAIDNYRSLTIS